jgi:glycosyltransferase involved in cell wall biosynthesis
MSKPARDGVSVVIPAHNCAAALDRVLPVWASTLANWNRQFEIVVVNDGSTDDTATVLQKRAPVPHLRVFAHEARRGFGACLRTALAEVKYPLFLYCGVDYPYVPADSRAMLDRIDLRDEVLGKQPDLISGARAGAPRPFVVKVLGSAWALFWRAFAGLPVADPHPWYGVGAALARWRAKWVFGVPLADVHSAFKLYRTAFLKRFPIQSDGDFVHTELVSKATFLTSIMDEVPLSPASVPFPVLGALGADRKTVFRDPQFAFPPEPPAPVEAPAPAAT